MKTSLVLEGGGLRGIFTAGVLDYLIEKKVNFPYVVGTSAGACNMLGFLSNQVGYTRDCMIQKDALNRYFGFNQLLKTGKILNLDQIFLDYFYNNNPFDFETYFSSITENELVVTNCSTGKAEYIQEHKDRKRLSALVKASSSLPIFTPMVNIDGQYYLDGALSDSIPIQRAMEKGYPRAVVILTRNEGDTVTLTSIQKRIYRSYYRSYPELLHTILARPAIYQRQQKYIQELEESRKIFVLRPQIPTVRRFETDYNKLICHYQHGYELMEKEYEAFRNFMLQR